MLVTCTSPPLLVWEDQPVSNCSRPHTKEPEHTQLKAAVLSVWWLIYVSHGNTSNLTSKKIKKTTEKKRKEEEKEMTLMLLRLLKQKRSCLIQIVSCVIDVAVWMFMQKSVYCPWNKNIWIAYNLSSSLTGENTNRILNPFTFCHRTLMFATRLQRGSDLVCVWGRTAVREFEAYR